MGQLQTFCSCGAEIMQDVDDATLANPALVEMLKEYCKCETCITAAENARKEDRLQNVIIPKRIKESRLPVDFWPEGFDKNKLPLPELYDFVYVNKYKSIVLSDIYDAGKTGTLVHFGLERCKYEEVLFYLVPDLMQELESYEKNFAKEGYFDFLMNRCKTVSLLILVDVGKEQKKGKFRQWLYQITDHRYTYNLQTWSDTNRDDDEWRQLYGKDSAKPILKRLTGKYGEIWDNRLFNKLEQEKRAS